MSYMPRQYPEIVRDLLTTLTGGTVAETLQAPAGDSLLTPAKLRDRPVRRVSHLQGYVGSAESPIPYRFTSADFELVSSAGNDDLDAIAFREGGRRPIPSSALTVNYYPVRTNPTPLNDLNVGSVVRTLLETVAYELAVSYQHLDFIYKSAFLESAEGRSLDKVVALVGVARLASGHPIANVRFTRQSGDNGRITVPAGTALTDAEGSRYLTQEELILEPGESTRNVISVGETPATPEVARGALDRLEVLVAGVESVSNEQPARRLAQPESDTELRRRARGAFHGVARGTLDALRFQLLSLEEVKDVSITEAPNGVPGEVRIDVAYATDTPEARAKVDARIRQVRPAGIRVTTSAAARRRLGVRVELTLAGTGLPGAEIGALQAQLAGVLEQALNAVPAGGTLRRARLSALALSDARVADARVVLTTTGTSAESEELVLEAGETAEVVPPVQFAPVQTEQIASELVAADVSATLPVHLTPGTTAADATRAIESGLASHLATRAADAPLTLDSLAAAIRDDSRFALVRAEATLTVEAAGRFFQLTDGVGAYAPAANESLRAGVLAVEVREGGV